MNIELDIALCRIDMTNEICFLKMFKNKNSKIVRQSRENEM